MTTIDPEPGAIRNMAVYCDFENIALGARDAKYAKFNVDKVLERLLLKGNIVVRKAYCDWERYKTFKKPMHEAAFELIEIPHVRQSGKNSADIRMVVDALDLCYTKNHVSIFVIISGDSDFSPLVSKLRENNKLVIGVGVKNSTSDLFISNCDEFIFYDDLVDKRKPARKQAKKSASKSSANSKSKSKEKESRSAARGGSSSEDEIIDFLITTFEDLVGDREGDSDIWGSMLKQAMKRRRPSFNESHYGFRSFNKLLEEARDRGLVHLASDDKSGGYRVRPVS